MIREDNGIEFEVFQATGSDVRIAVLTKKETGQSFNPMQYMNNPQNIPATLPYLEKITYETVTINRDPKYPASCFVNELCHVHVEWT